jgi:hypothetical protein
LGPIRLGKAGDSVRQRENNQSRARTSREFNATLKITGNLAEPHFLRYEIDAPPGTPVVTEAAAALIKHFLGITLVPNSGAINLPPGDKTVDPSLSLDFNHTFTGPGSHLVSVVVEPDLPPDGRPKGYKVRDRLAADNRRDFAVNLPRVPVLLIDSSPDKEKVLRYVFPLEKRPNWLLRAQEGTLDDMQEALFKDLNNEVNTPPRVLVLCDLEPRPDPANPGKHLPPLTKEQVQAVDKFVREGGGVLITLGPKADAEAWNALYSGKDGLLPTKLLEAVGKIDERDKGARPDMKSLQGPALEPFRSPELGRLSKARFARWWRLATPPAGTGAKVLGLLDSDLSFLADEHDGLAGLATSKTPFIVEKPLGKGKVMIAAVPMNDTWNTNLHQGEVEVFGVLINGLAANLSGQRGLDTNLAPGQPLVYDPAADESAEEATLRSPAGVTTKLQGRDGRFTFKDTRLPGVSHGGRPEALLRRGACVGPGARGGNDLLRRVGDDHVGAGS